MYRVSWERSTISAEGAQRTSAWSVLSSTARSLHGCGLGGRRRLTASRLAIQEAGAGDDEVGRGGQRRAVHALRHVVVGVVPGGQVAVGIGGADRDGAHLVDAGREGIVEQGVPDGTRLGRAGAGERLAEL